MALTSFPVKCPCSKCKGEKMRELVQAFSGKWFCPMSSEMVDDKKGVSPKKGKNNDH